MATIDYKEKYEQALEKARQLCAYPTSKPFISDLQDLFPELKEKKDDDERVWEELIELVSYCADGEFPHKSEWLAWLELHKERVI